MDSLKRLTGCYTDSFISALTFLIQRMICYILYLQCFFFCLSYLVRSQSILIWVLYCPFIIIFGWQFGVEVPYNNNNVQILLALRLTNISLLVFFRSSFYLHFDNDHRGLNSNQRQFVSDPRRSPFDIVLYVSVLQLFISEAFNYPQEAIRSFL